MPAKNTINTVLFDLDGTLLDTAKDFAYTINLMRSKQNQPPIDFKQLYQRVFGAPNSNAMVSFAFNIPIEDPAFKAIKQSFLESYLENCTQHTDYFPGISMLLNYLDAQKIQWGIVTNKPSFLTAPIVKHFQFDTRACCIISGDTLPEHKPHPAPLLHACKISNTTPDKTIYVGDLETDIIAAKAAKMLCIVAEYGYCSPDAKLHTWGGDFIAKTPRDILFWLSERMALQQKAHA